MGIAVKTRERHPSLPGQRLAGRNFYEVLSISCYTARTVEVELRMVCACSAFSSTPLSYEEVVDRCNAAARIEKSLVQVGSNPDEWLAVHECKQCRQLWAEERPFSEQHGGGSPCYYPLTGTDPDTWLSDAEPIAQILRARHDDAEFLATLGPEVGPAQCQNTACNRLTVKQSVLCSRHHFEMVKKRQA